MGDGTATSSAFLLSCSFFSGAPTKSSTLIVEAGDTTSSGLVDSGIALDADALRVARNAIVVILRGTYETPHVERLRMGYHLFNVITEESVNLDRITSRPPALVNTRIRCTIF